MNIIGLSLELASKLERHIQSSITVLCQHLIELHFANISAMTIARFAIYAIY